MSDSVQQIKDRLSVVDVVAPYVELHKAGKNFKGKSPFTNEKTPSFYVSPDRGMYYCFSSSQGGDIFTFVQSMEGVDFKGALKILADKAGVELVPEDPKKRDARDTQYAILEEATKFFQGWLPQKKDAEQYLIDRGVTVETIGKWRIGYAPGPPHNGWRHAREHLKGLQFTDEAITAAGLSKTADQGKEPYDVFRDRIMFPIFDASGRIVAYSGRVLEKDTEAPKYVNSPETELFNKSEILYGYDKAKQGIRTFDFSLIVEGQFDVVLSHQAGYTNAVAVSGTGMTEHHVALLQRLSNRVVLALDADRAGIAAVKRAADLMLARGMDVKVAEIPEGKDPADLIAADPKEFKEVIGKATHVIEFLLHVLKRESSDERNFKLRSREEIIPYLARIDNHIDREHFEGLVADTLGSTKDAVHLEVARFEANQAPVKPKPVVTQEAKKLPEVQTAERKRAVRNYLVVVHEMLPTAKKAILAKKYTEITDTNIVADYFDLDAGVKSQFSFTLENTFADMREKTINEEVTDKLEELRVLTIKFALAEKKQLLQEAEAQGDEEAFEALMKEMTDLQKKLSEPAITSEIFSPEEA